MRKEGDQIVTRVKQLLTDAIDRWTWYPDELDYRQHGVSVEVYRDGRVRAGGLGTVPLDWTQRRSVARAFRRAHATLTANLVRLGQQAKQAQAQPLPTPGDPGLGR